MGQRPGKFAAFPYSPGRIAFHFVLPQENGLPRRGAAAPLLAMTCKNLLRVRTARTHYRGKFATVYEFALSAAFSWRYLRGRGLPRRFAPRNDRGEVSLRATSLHPRTPAHLLHVIALSPLAPAHTSPPSACHCEPVRTLVWQSASPQQYLASQ